MEKLNPRLIAAATTPDATHPEQLMHPSRQHAAEFLSGMRQPLFLCNITQAVSNDADVISFANLLQDLHAYHFFLPLTENKCGLLLILLELTRIYVRLIEIADHLEVPARLKGETV